MNDKIFNSVYNSLYMKTTFRKVTGDSEIDSENPHLTDEDIDKMILYFEILKNPFYRYRIEVHEFCSICYKCAISLKGQGA